MSVDENKPLLFYVIVRSIMNILSFAETLIEKFRPDMRMLSVPSYALYEVHSNGEERKLNADEKPLLVQLNWHIDDREGRFLLRNTDQTGASIVETVDTNFKRKLSKREKKEQKKKEKLAKMNSNPSGDAENNHVAEKLYTELPETSFTRSISNPEAVMRRRRQQILEKKLQQFRSKDGGPDTGSFPFHSLIPFGFPLLLFSINIFFDLIDEKMCF